MGTKSLVLVCLESAREGVLVVLFFSAPRNTTTKTKGTTTERNISVSQLIFFSDFQGCMSFFFAFKNECLLRGYFLGRDQVAGRGLTNVCMHGEWKVGLCVL